MDLESLPKQSRKIAGRAKRMIERRNKGSYLFFNQAMTSVIALENKEANMPKICARKVSGSMIGYYAPDTSFMALKRDILKGLSEDKYKPVEEPEL